MLTIFGHNGQVARELRKAAALAGIEIYSHSSESADFRKPDRIAEIVGGLPIGSIVINAAAYTQVDQAETDEIAAIRVNASTPGLIASICSERKCKLIHISTDYVFSGEKHVAYQEDDPVQPLGVYGNSKLLGEYEILKNLKQAIILRTSWVFSSHGKNFVKTMARLGAERDELSVVIDQTGGPTSAESIARTCLDLAEKIHALPESSEYWGVYHYAGSPATTWHGFAVEVFRLTNQNVKVNPIKTSQYPLPARRPQNSILNCEKIADNFGIQQPDWKADLSLVLEEMGYAPGGGFYNAVDVNDSHTTQELLT